jgi:hypothetical protein
MEEHKFHFDDAFLAQIRIISLDPDIDQAPLEKDVIRFAQNRI